MALSTSLDGVLRSLRAGAGRREVGGVFGRWEEVAGPAVAAHVRPVRLEGATLVVEVDEPAWATQMRFLTAELRQRLVTTVGVTIDDVEVRVAGARGSARR